MQGGRQRLGFQQHSICHLSHVPSSTPAEAAPSFPQTHPLPRPARSRPFCSLPRAMAPSPSTRQPSPCSPPPCTSPHPGWDSKAGVHSETGLWGPAGRNGAGEGPQGSLFVAPVSPGGRGRGHGRSALTNLFPRTAGPTRKTGPRGRTGRGTQGARATDTHQPPQLCPPPSTERKAEIIPQKRKQSNQVRPNPIK